jgi:predicted DNA-binding protein (UPF0251 family)
LPKDLPSAIKHLDDRELDQLLKAAHAEHKRRGYQFPLSIESTSKQRIQETALILTVGKLNAIRAAFKAGVKPSQIAKKFGVSQSDVSKAVASDASKNKSSPI